MTFEFKINNGVAKSQCAKFVSRYMPKYYENGDKLSLTYSLHLFGDKDALLGIWSLNDIVEITGLTSESMANKVQELIQLSQAQAWQQLPALDLCFAVFVPEEPVYADIVAQIQRLLGR